MTDRQKIFRLLVLALLLWTVYYLFSIWVKSGNQLDEEYETHTANRWFFRMIAEEPENPSDSNNPADIPLSEAIPSQNTYRQFEETATELLEPSDSEVYIQSYDSYLKVTGAVADIVKAKTKCNDISLVPRLRQRQNYWVYYNYMKADLDFGCAESVSLTANCEYNYMDNVIALAERWQGPISMTIYAPGDDFKPSIESILYLRECETSLIRNLVTFHVFFDKDLIPSQVPSPEELVNRTVNCSVLPPFLSIKNNKDLFRVQKQLPYYINVARNIARESVQTHFVFPVDVELYPSPNISIQFLNMLARSETELYPKRVYPVHIYEVKAIATVPQTKARLKEMLRTGEAIPFHKRVCPACHGIPDSGEWLAIPETGEMHVQTVAERMGPYASWEPIYIGTQNEPLYDERLTWDGMSDKIVQSYILCNMNYEFAVLDTGFLVHRPGIKISTKLEPGRGKYVSITSKLKNVIKEETKRMFGTVEGCHL